MSYISSADAAAIRASFPAKSAQSATSGRIRVGLPVGPVLEVALFVTTSFAVSFVFCTTIAGALLH